MKEFKELKEGIYQLIPVNRKGEYANINTNTGLILYCRRTSNLLPTQSKINVLTFQKLVSNDKRAWCAKEFFEWRNQYSEVYNRMIDRINNLELIFE